MSRFGLDYALDTMGVVIGAIKILCNISNYSSGVVPFVRRAPLNLDQDYMLTPNLTTNVNIHDGLESYFVDIDIDVNEPNDQLDYVADLLQVLSGQFALVYISSSDKWQLFVRDDTGAVSGSVVSTNVVGNKKSALCVGVDHVLDVAYLEWDGVRSTVDLSTFGAITVRALGLFSQVLGLRAVKLLAYEIRTSTNLWGDWDVVSNVSDGQDFTSTTGKTIALNEVGGTGQYPNYTPTDPNDITDPQPAYGDIYIDGNLVGNRDKLTGVFTPDPAYPAELLIDDRYQIGDTCVTVPTGQEIVTHLTIPVTNNGVVVTHDIL